MVVLGMHRSGTSCISGMLVAHGFIPPGNVVRNWDNERGHFEATRAVRLNEAVLAHSGGHWLSPPTKVCWTAEHAAERDALLTCPGTLLKDPRTLLTLAFWRASTLPMRMIGIVRAPLAVARSLSSWRQMPVVDGMALWQAHNRTLLQVHRELDAFPLLDFDQSESAFLTAVEVAFAQLGITADADVVRQSYVRELVHHDAFSPAADSLSTCSLSTCSLSTCSPASFSKATMEVESLHAELRKRCLGAGSTDTGTAPRAFPWAQLSALRVALAAGNHPEAVIQALRACTAPGDPAAVAVPVIADLVRAGQVDAARQVMTILASSLNPALGDLLAGKIALAGGNAQIAVACFTRACAVPEPFWEARQLLPHALRRAGQRDAARAAQVALVPNSLYPHGILATLAEWAWADDDQVAALDWSRQAITAAPSRRRGRLRTRRAAWLRQRGDTASADGELSLAHEEDPGFFAAKQPASSTRPASG